MSQTKRLIIFLIYIAVISIICALSTGYLFINKALFGQYTFLVPPFLNMIAGIVGAIVIFKKNFNR